MNTSLRARLAIWSSVVVIAVLLAGAVVALVAQRQLALSRLDEELARLMLTLEGVMRTEINEGLTLQASADEASAEVVAPDRMLILNRPDGERLAAWGLSLPPGWTSGASVTGHQTIPAGGSPIRFFRRDIAYKGHEYIAGVGVPLDALAAEQRELVEALAIGLTVALALAALGGLWIGRRTLGPLESLANQAMAMSGSDATQRLRSPGSTDELDRLAAAFNGLLDRLAAALHSQRQFMADASHELRTPVSIVRTTAQVALGRTDRAPGEYRESLEIVEEQTARMTRLVNAMFLLARAEANGIPMQPEPAYLDELVNEAVRGLRVLADARDVSVRVEGLDELPMHGDPHLLRTMIGNLLDNAIRFAQPGGVVRVQLSRGAAALRLTVTDDGPGVPAGDRERIFERFVRADTRSDGAGLGLPIARWVAEAHGGTLVLATSVSPGAQFVVHLPLNRPL